MDFNALFQDVERHENPQLKTAGPDKAAISTAIRMDCTKGMERLPDSYFDLAVVDPPYGLSEKLTTGGTWASKYSSDDSKWDIPPDQHYFDELFRVSKNQIIWGGNYFALPKNRCFLIWDKVAHMETLADCEYAWTSFDSNAKVFQRVRNINNEARIHICQKPVALYEWIFRRFTNPGDTILDTHLGSQSSRIAASKHGLPFLGFEIAPNYFLAGNKRFDIFSSQLRIF